MNVEHFECFAMASKPHGSVVDIVAASNASDVQTQRDRPIPDFGVLEKEMQPFDVGVQTESEQFGVVGQVRFVVHEVRDDEIVA